MRHVGRIVLPLLLLSFGCSGPSLARRGANEALGVTVRGLRNAGLVLAAGDARMPIAKDGAFTLAAPTRRTADVRVAEQPAGATQHCRVDPRPVGAIEIVCVDVGYRIGGRVSGLIPGRSVVISDGVEELTLATDGAFTFPVMVEDRVEYAVGVVRQPNGATCRPRAATGTIRGASIDNVTIECKASRRARTGRTARRIASAI